MCVSVTPRTTTKRRLRDKRRRGRERSPRACVCVCKCRNLYRGEVEGGEGKANYLPCSTVQVHARVELKSRPLLPVAVAFLSPPPPRHRCRHRHHPSLLRCTSEKTTTENFLSLSPHARAHTHTHTVCVHTRSWCMQHIKGKPSSLSGPTIRTHTERNCKGDSLLRRGGGSA